MRGPRPSGPARLTSPSGVGGRAIGGRAGCAFPAPPLGFASVLAAPVSAFDSAAGLASAAGAPESPSSAAADFAALSAAGFASAFGFAPSALAFAPVFAFAPSAFAFAPAFAFAGAFVAVAPLPNAFAASPSSTLEAAAVTPRPAFWRISRASFEVIPRSLAISWTRFFAIR